MKATTAKGEKVMKKATDILREAKSLLQKVGWCRGAFERRNKDGKVVAYCAIGALRAVQTPGASYEKAIALLANTLGIMHRDVLALKWSIEDWNDRPHSSKKKILAAFDKAIKMGQKSKAKRKS